MSNLDLDSNNYVTQEIKETKKEERYNQLEPPLRNIENTSLIQGQEQKPSEPDIDFADLDPDYDPALYSDCDIQTLEIEKETLQKQIASFKSDIEKYGFDTNSKKFSATMAVFQRFNFDCSRMVEMFTEVQDVLMEKRNIQHLKDEVDERISILDVKLEQLGLGDVEQLKKIIVAHMTLENFGIGIEQIISLTNEQIKLSDVNTCKIM